MFQCERCGSGYSSTRIVGIEHCPRCLLKDETMAPLSLKVFDLPESSEPPPGPPERAGAEALDAM